MGGVFEVLDNGDNVVIQTTLYMYIITHYKVIHYIITHYTVIHYTTFYSCNTD